MALTSGFFNSSSGDRVYDASQFSAMFDGVITDGIFSTYGKAFAVKATTTENTVTVDTGRAWFNGTWTLNDSILSLELPSGPTTGSRIDGIILQIDKTNRENKIIAQAGTGASAPALARTASVSEYMLAEITRPALSTTITQSQIKDRRGKAGVCPFAAGAVTTVTTDSLLTQWNAQFYDWFATVQGVLDDDAAGNLLTLVNDLQSDVNAQASTVASILNNQVNQTELHRSIYSGVDRSSVSNASIKSMLAANDFSKLRLGDYFVRNGRKWIIADSNYWVANGDLASGFVNGNPNHLILIPANLLSLSTAQTISGANTTTGGYLGSRLSKSYAIGGGTKSLASFFSWARSDFGNSILTLVTQRWPSAVDNDGVVTATANVSTYVDCLNSVMVWGFGPHAAESYSGGIGAAGSYAMSMLRLFEVRPQLRIPEVKHSSGENAWWLSDVLKNSRMACVSGRGNLNAIPVNESRGVRPFITLSCGVVESSGVYSGS